MSKTLVNVTRGSLILGQEENSSWAMRAGHPAIVRQQATQAVQEGLQRCPREYSHPNLQAPEVGGEGSTCPGALLSS